MLRIEQKSDRGTPSGNGETHCLLPSVDSSENKGWVRPVPAAMLIAIKQSVGVSTVSGNTGSSSGAREYWV